LLNESFFHVCWSIDCESCRKEINDVELGKKSILGFCRLLEEYGFRGTLFLMPEEIVHMPDLLGKMAEMGHETALHLHPDESGYPTGYLGCYSAAMQEEIVEKALDEFSRVLGLKPVSVRTGFGSANDLTFLVLNKLGFDQSSCSFPGRKMSGQASNWAGAPLFTHYVHPYNRFLEGGLDLIEMPVSVDWETMIWGGIHPQDLRVEFTDAKNHGFLIRKIMKRQISDGLSFKALLPFTHNLFDYSDKQNFRHETMRGMLEEMIKTAREHQHELLGTTLKDAANRFRQTVPFVS
jgi:peptidoglycan/xylan/chitin deacetylase (PgdA/CDA1 family)